MKKLFIFFIVFVGVGLFLLRGYFWWQDNELEIAEPDLVEKGDDVVVIDSFEDCLAAGNVVMESYPRQCRTADGQHFVEEIGNELEKADLIQLDSPRPNGTITSPLTIIGQARGYWFFEATFPVILTDWDGRIIASHYAEAKDDWMTEEFVPFEVTLEFDSPVFEGVGKDHFSRRGSLILQKDNPSGLPEHDDALEIPVWFEF